MGEKMGDVSRRDFLKIAAVSTGAIAFVGCSPFPSSNEFLVQSTPDLPEDLATGVDNWYASVCRECRGGCGIIVRVNEGRALKIEGNPDYPVNRGKLCARGQLGVQALYHPDRLKGPMRRSGDRGSGKYDSITWDDARQELLNRLRGLASGAGPLFIGGPPAGHRGMVVDRFTSALGGQHMVFEPIPQTVIEAAVRRVFVRAQLPHFDIARSQYLLSFGADFLGTWLSPAQYNLAYGEFRQGRPNRGHFVQIEPRLSQTGANADEWLPINPGTEGLLALAIAHALVASGKADARATQALLGAAGGAALDPYAPERVAAAIGIAPERIAGVARDFAAQQPALAVGGLGAAGHTNGLFNLTAILALNVLSGNVGKPGGVIYNPEPPLADLAARQSATFAEWQRLSDQLRSGQANIGLLMLQGANPVHGLPASTGIADALAKIPYIVSFSSMMDETTALADLILPDHNSLETWGDDAPNPAPGIQAMGVQQPLVNPLYDTRDFADVLLSLAPDLGGQLQRNLPWSTYRDVIHAAAQQLQGLLRGSISGTDQAQYWNTLLQKGGWWDDKAAPPATSAAPAPISIPAQPPQPDFGGTANEYPFHLIAYPHLSLGHGETASLPWAQSTPDPMVTAAWDTWVEINPETARELGVERNDMVSVRSANGSIEVAVYPYPAIAKNVVAIPLGQGHNFGGRWAEQRGANVLSILAPLADAETGALALNATRVNITRTGRKADLPVYEGVKVAVELEPGSIVPTVPS